MKHLKLFKTSSELENGIKVETPNVSYLKNKNVVYIPSSIGKEAIITYNEGSDEMNYEKYVVPAVMFTAKAANSTVGLSKKSSNQTLEYSTDGSTWTNMTTGTTITLANSGDSVYVRGVLSSNNTGSNYTQFKMTGNIKSSGNINYLWNKDNPDAALKQYCGYYLFQSCTALTDISELELPATTLASSCYSRMFFDCTSLTTAPALPATTLASSCYQYMFRGCTSLTTAPVLPATTLAPSCYLRMFSFCTSLTTAPVLPATTLKIECYAYMFQGCTSLTTAPVLPATTLEIECYAGMFYDCSNLNYIKCFATNISASSCINSWVYGVASTGTFVKDASMTGWTTGYNGIPTDWIIYDTTPLQSITISGETNVVNCETYTIEYNPSTTYEREIIWSIISGSQHATINENTGELKVLSGTSGDAVVIRATSLVNSGVTDEKTIAVTYVPLQFITISGETNVIDRKTYTIEYNPSTTYETGVTWKIVSGGEYATINENTGVLTPLSGASSNTVVIGATSLVNSGITDEKTIAVTYVPALIFTAKQNNSTVGLSKLSSNQTLEYSTNGSTWGSMTTDTTITLSNSGDSVYVRGMLSGDNTWSNYTQFTMTGGIKVRGNINYLWNKDNPDAALRFYCGYYLFQSCTALTDISELELPATTLAYYCYAHMFYGCRITTAPALPATTLENGCYKNMFYGCTSLTTAPELPATTLATECYYNMFYGCTNLNYIKCLATNISANSCINSWVFSVASTGTFVKDASMTGWPTGISGIPSNWTVEDAV